MGQGQGVDYPLLLSSIFNNYFNGLPIVDKFEDACIGHFGVAEICLQGFSVFHRNRTMQIEIPMLNAGEYHIEVWEQEDTTAHSEESSVLFVDKFKGHDVARKMVPTRAEEVAGVANLEFWLDYSDQVSFWWAHHFGLERQTLSWLEMFDEAFEAARPLIDRGGQIIEFGVAHGRSLARLGENARRLNRTVVGFDSFRGLPEAWGPKFDTPGLFDMGGVIPARVLREDNIAIKVGLFRDTIPLLDWGAPDAFVSFLHVDCDIYSSALQILTTVGCLLQKGSVVVFDELFNMQGTYTARNNTRTPWWEDGEFLALQHSMQLLGLEFEPLPSRLYFEQAVPLVVTRAAPSEVCDTTRHEMMGIQIAAEGSEAVNALLSIRLTAAHLIQEWSGDPPDNLKGVFDSAIDRDTAEGVADPNNPRVTLEQDGNASPMEVELIAKEEGAPADQDSSVPSNAEVDGTRFSAGSFFGWTEKRCRLTCYASTKQDVEGNVMNAAMWSNDHNSSRTCCICLNSGAINDDTCREDCRYYLPFMQHDWQRVVFLTTCHRMCDEVHFLRAGLQEP
ncbi:hypothetical protein FOZ61_008961 [Perkinsus olseni]|uniref:Uncharacterized protein n=1 Tax=Perkinsus olseni TaxID=32597 RepID=A0A7J6M5Y8_PEROL|nr:hypothetical protein FOZ61_008961 [Perkinsus olseni]